MVINRNARKELYFDTQRGVLIKFVVKVNSKLGDFSHRLQFYP